MAVDPIVAMLVGAISVLWLAYSGVLWTLLQSERKRVDRLDQITEGALATTATVLQRTELVVDLLKEIKAEQGHAKDREEWRR